MTKAPFSFSLQDLCWLTLVAALLCTWLIERGRVAALEAAKREGLKREEQLATEKKIVTMQFAELQLKMAERGYRFYFNIVQRPGAEPEVQLVEDEE